MLKKIIIFAIFALCFTQSVFATEDLSKTIAGKAGYDKTATETSLSQQIGTVIKGALTLVGIIFIALMIYAGFLWMTAAGEEDKVTKATGIIKFAVIGLIIIVSAYSLTYFVLGAVTGANKGDGGPGGGQGGCCIEGGWNVETGLYNIKVNSPAECTEKCEDIFGIDRTCNFSPGDCPST